jgi:hypothetical protein
MNGPVLATISPQWIGIAVASAIVVVLLVILVIRRVADDKRDRRPDSTARDDRGASDETPTPPQGSASFLDEPLRGGFDGLGKPASGQPALGTIVMPKERRPEQSWQEAAPSARPPAVHPFGAIETPVAPFMPEPEPRIAPEPAPLQEALPTAPGAAPLSDIIVTTNQQEIDLNDPEVRQMLEELVTSEIALAEAYRQQGQVLDAILQLTEAEKACTALGNGEQSERIKALMKELQP